MDTNSYGEKDLDMTYRRRMFVTWKSSRRMFYTGVIKWLTLMEGFLRIARFMQWANQFDLLMIFRILEGESTPRIVPASNRR